jgi:nonsense-mediated mRNA decay protein 3
MVTMDYEPSSAGQESYILCADCGTVISSANGSGLCALLSLLRVVACFIS